MQDFPLLYIVVSYNRMFVFLCVCNVIVVFGDVANVLLSRTDTTYLNVTYE